MMLLGYLIVAMLGWLFAALVFEGGYEQLKKQPGWQMAKAPASRIYWSVLGLLSFVINSPALVFNLPVLLPIALSHINLCQQQAANISAQQIVQYMGQAVAGFTRRMFSGIKRWKP